MSVKLKKAPNERLNRILSLLPATEFAGISADLRSVSLERNTVLFEADEHVESVYFPATSTISFLGDTGEGSRVEVWSVGNEGLAGLSGLLGKTKPFRGVVQISGAAFMGNADRMRRHFSRCNAFHQAIVDYYHALLIQVSYLGVCNSAHNVDQRLCRWLLMAQDRTGGSVLNFTQDYIAGVLGTRRATITVAAAALQSANLISYTPGSITIKRRKGLQAAACSCYKVIRSWL